MSLHILLAFSETTSVSSASWTCVIGWIVNGIYPHSSGAFLKMLCMLNIDQQLVFRSVFQLHSIKICLITVPSLVRRVKTLFWRQDEEGTLGCGLITLGEGRTTWYWFESILLSRTIIHKGVANTPCQTFPFMLRFEERDLVYSTVNCVCESMCVHLNVLDHEASVLKYFCVKWVLAMCFVSQYCLYFPYDLYQIIVISKNEQNRNVLQNVEKTNKFEIC